MNGLLKNKVFLFFSCVIIIIAVGAGIFLASKKRKLYKQSYVMMGTFVEVISPDKRAPFLVFCEVDRLDNLLSKFKPESDISKLNQFSRMRVSDDTLYVLRQSREFWIKSAGAFDVTVGPLMDIWGFTDRKFKVPKPQAIKDALKRVDMNKVIFDDATKTISLAAPGMKIDLGAIAKGYALDCAIRKLKDNGITSALVNIGGEVYCLGDNFGQPWVIVVRSPRGEYVSRGVKIKDQAVATSGDYEQFFISNNKRYNHIMDPKTGRPADAGVTSVTVIADSGMDADALSTSIFVLGKKKGLKMLEAFPHSKAIITEEKDIEAEE